MTAVPIRPPARQGAPTPAENGSPPRYLVTGGTGFIGSRLVPRLLALHPDARVWVLVRPRSLVTFERTAAAAGWGSRLLPLVGDVTAPALGLNAEMIDEIGDLDHVVHCAAIYDITASDAAQRAANVEGTRAVIALATTIGATLHHVSSIAVAGSHPGTFTEADFDLGNSFRRRITRRSSRPSTWCEPNRGCGTASTAPAWWWVTPAPARWTRSTARTTSSDCSPSWRACPGSRRCGCPTSDATTSFRSTTSSTQWPS